MSGKTHVPEKWVACTIQGRPPEAEDWTFHPPCGQSGNWAWKTWSYTPTCKTCQKWLAKGGKPEPLPRACAKRSGEDKG